MSALRTRKGPRTLIGLLAALGLVAVLAVPAFANHEPPNGPEVTPTAEEFPGGEPTCETGVAIRFNNPAEGDDADVDLGGGATATVTILSVDNNALTFEVEGGLAAIVTVKGGVSTPGTDDQNVYDYTGLPGGGIAHDDGLTNPNEQGLSHVDFCLVAAAPPPSEAPPSEVAESELPAESEVPAESEAPAESVREDTLGGTPTPAPEVPDTAMGDVGQMPATVLSLVLVGALAAMVYVRMARER